MHRIVLLMSYIHLLIMEKVIFLTASLAVANAGLLNHLLPAVEFNANVREEFHDPSYQFNYDVQDPSQGSHHSQSERRTGDRVDGSYSLIEPDGQRRIVHYTSDKDVGFTAHIVREPTGQFIHRSPIRPYPSNEYLPPSSSAPSLPSPPHLPELPILPPQLPPQEPASPLPVPPVDERPQLPLPPVAPSPPSLPLEPSLPPSPPSLPPAVYGPPPVSPPSLPSPPFPVPPIGELPQFPLPPVETLPPSLPLEPSQPPSPPVLPPSVYGPPPKAPATPLPKIYFSRNGLTYSFSSSPFYSYSNHF